MSQNSKDYKNGKIYCIRNNIDDNIYVGSTTQSLSKRIAKHREAAKRKNYMHRTFYSKVNEIGIEHFYVELIEDCPCETLEQLRKREGHYIRKMGTLNHKIAGRTGKEYHEINKDKIQIYQKEYQKEYAELNKEKIQIYRKEYTKVNKEKIQQNSHEYYEAHKQKLSEKVICVCGGKPTLHHKLEHERTKKHQQYIQQFSV